MECSGQRHDLICNRCCQCGPVSHLQPGAIPAIWQSWPPCWPQVSPPTGRCASALASLVHGWQCSLQSAGKMSGKSTGGSSPYRRSLICDTNLPHHFTCCTLRDSPMYWSCPSGEYMLYTPAVCGNAVNPPSAVLTGTETPPVLALGASVWLARITGRHRWDSGALACLGCRHVKGLVALQKVQPTCKWRFCLNAVRLPAQPDGMESMANSRHCDSVHYFCSDSFLTHFPQPVPFLSSDPRSQKQTWLPGLEKLPDTARSRFSGGKAESVFGSNEKNNSRTNRRAVRKGQLFQERASFVMMAFSRMGAPALGLAPSFSRPYRVRVRCLSSTHERNRDTVVAKRNAEFSAAEQLGRQVALLSAVAPLLVALPAFAQLDPASTAALADSVAIPLILSSLAGGAVYAALQSKETKEVLSQIAEGVR